MQITIQIKNVYGVEKIYPVCESAKTFCAMLNQKTLTDMDIRYIKELGYGISVSQADLPAVLTILHNKYT